MPVPDRLPKCTQDPEDFTADQLALPTSEKVTAYTQYGPVTGGRVKNGCQVFLNVPYGKDVPRFTDPKPLDSTFRYSSKPYVHDGRYAAQPAKTGRAPGEHGPNVTMRNKLGEGEPTDSPFFADIYVNSKQDLPSLAHILNGKRAPRLLPVRVFFHGGFLQYGSTHGRFRNQQYFQPEILGEVRVMLGYRLSAFGFLASEKPYVAGNFGLKDAWLGLEWIRDNIAAFGGDPDRVDISGLSGGSHLVHQLLHRAAQLSPAKAPFVSALCQSNAILSNSTDLAARAEQFEAFCSALGADPTSPSILSDLRDPSKHSIARMCDAIDDQLGFHSVFRPVTNTIDGWLSPSQMEYQESGAFARDLSQAGVRCVVIGDCGAEAQYYSTVYACKEKGDIVKNLQRFYPDDTIHRLLRCYPSLPEDATPQECNAFQGQCLADAQVYLPARLLAQDLANHGVSAIRYTCKYLVEGITDTEGTPSHGVDTPIHILRLPLLSQRDREVSLDFVRSLQVQIDQAVESGVDLQGRIASKIRRSWDEVMTLDHDGSIHWGKDARLPVLRPKLAIIRGD